MGGMTTRTNVNGLARRTLLGVLLVAGLLGSRVQGAVLFEDDFESYVLGDLATVSGTWGTYTGNPNHGGRVVVADALVGGGAAPGGGTKSITGLPSNSLFALRDNLNLGLTGNETAIALDTVFNSNAWWVGPRWWLINSNTLGGGVIQGAGGNNKHGFNFHDALGNEYLSSTGDGLVPINTWIEYRMLFDLTANGGNGSMSAFYRTDLDGSGSFENDAWQAVTALQDINVHLLDAGRTWASINRLYGRMDTNNTARTIDLVRISNVPEPASLGLLGAGVLVMLKRRDH